MASGLSEENELQVQCYLRFAKLKRCAYQLCRVLTNLAAERATTGPHAAHREQHVRETLLVIRDFTADRVAPAEMYNAKDLHAMFKELEAAVTGLVDKAGCQLLLLLLLLLRSCSLSLAVCD
jgi:hypothetical protein